MKKITSFIFACALLAGLTGLAGCQNPTDDPAPQQGGNNNNGDPSKGDVDLKNGGIFGSMQGWKAEDAKWTKAEGGTYEYQFKADGAEAEWKVLVNKALDKGAYVGDLTNKTNKWNVNVGAPAIPLSFAQKADDGSSLITKGLDKGTEYKIVIKMVEKKVTAKVERIPGKDLAKDLFKEGGIIGDMMPKKGNDWDASKAMWTNSDPAKGIYTYKFKATTNRVEWRVLLKKGEWNGAWRGDDAENKAWLVKIGADAIPLREAKNNVKGSNLYTDGLLIGSEYEITVMVKGDEVLASVKKIPGAPLAKDLLKDGGIIGTMQGWDATKAKWSASNPAVGTYEYQFTAAGETAEWKVLVKKALDQGAYVGDIANKANKWEIPLGADELPLSRTKKADDGSSLIAKGLKAGTPYKITVKIVGDEVKTSIKELPKAPLDKALLKDGGIIGSMQGWKAAEVKWTRPNVGTGVYEYDFTAPAAEVEWKVLVKKALDKDAYLGDLANKDNKWEVKFDESDPLPLNFAANADNGSSLVTKDLTPGDPYTLVVKIVGTEVKAYAKEGKKADLKKELLKDGGIIGSMQGWKAADAKWTKTDPAKGIYEYEFTADHADAEWKVLVGKGVDKGAYLGDIVNKDNKWEVKVGAKEIRLTSAKTADDGSSLISKGLMLDNPYKITVKIEGGNVTASIKMLPKGPLNKALFKDGGIMGSMQGWKAADAKWTNPNPATGVYEYQFNAPNYEVEFKVLTAKDADKDTYLGDLVNKDNRWDVKFKAEEAITLNHAKKADGGGNLRLAGLRPGNPYIIVVQIEGPEVKAYAKEGKKPTLLPALLKEGGIIGSMQTKAWNVADAKWTKADAVKGVYEYDFTAAAENAEFKVLTAKDLNKTAYVGNIVDKNDKWEVKFKAEEAIPLTRVEKADDGSVLILNDLEPGNLYRIVVKIVGTEVMVHAETPNKPDLKKDVLKEGGIYGAMQEWKADEVKWTTSDPTKGAYIYKFTATAKETEYKVLVGKDATKGAYLGDLKNKDNKWEVKFKKEEAIPLKYTAKADDGGSLILKDLKVGTPYNIHVDVVGSEVMTYAEELKKPALQKDLLKDGGVIGSMQGWKAETAAWTKKDPTKGIYEYAFVADGAEASWKVLLKNGELDKGVLVGDTDNKDNPWEVKFDEADPLSLNFVSKADDGSNLVLRNLEPGTQYNIIVKIDGSEAKAYAKKLTKFVPSANMLRTGGIIGSMQGWKAEEAGWTKDTTPNLYEYDFVANGEEAEWKVLVKKGELGQGAFVGELANKGNKWEIPLDNPAGIPLTYANTPDNGSSLYMKGLTIGDPYRITIKYEDKSFKAYAKALPKQALNKNFLKDGGIFGAMQNWNADKAKWTTKDGTHGTYTYVFVATADKLEWKVLVKSGDLSKGAFVGDLKNKDNKWVVDVTNTKGVPLNFATDLDSGSSLLSKDLSVGHAYKITVTIEDDKAVAKIVHTNETVAPEYNLKEGGIYSSINAWKADMAKWSTSPSDPATSGVYTYKFAAPGDGKIDWKILVYKGRESEGVIAGDPSNVNNAWWVKPDGQEWPTSYATKADTISALHTEGLVAGQEYTITVTVTGYRVTAKVEKK